MWGFLYPAIIVAPGLSFLAIASSDLPVLHLLQLHSRVEAIVSLFHWAIGKACLESLAACDLDQRGEHERSTAWKAKGDSALGRRNEPAVASVQRGKLSARLSPWEIRRDRRGSMAAILCLPFQIRNLGKEKHQWKKIIPQKHSTLSYRAWINLINRGRAQNAGWENPWGEEGWGFSIWGEETMQGCLLGVYEGVEE